MDGLSPLAWVAVAIIVIVSAFVNLWMVALLRNKDLRDQQLMTKRPPRGLSMQSMQKMVRVMRNPFGDEQEEMEKLSKMVQDLKDNEKDAPGQG
jgi:hypothetical protein